MQEEITADIESLADRIDALDERLRAASAGQEHARTTAETLERLAADLASLVDRVDNVERALTVDRENAGHDRNLDSNSSTHRTPSLYRIRPNGRGRRTRRVSVTPRL